MELVVKRCSHCEDYTELYEEDTFIMSGDYYHDKIDQRIEGFVAGIRYTGKDVLIKDEDIICEYCQFDLDYDKDN